ncbi:MAG TPA: U32 family peptidase [Tenuifilaceae bacterium]|nr:U32 family peptidase [Tenuifilaceae bacterium]HPN20717.1 U32 family peptidase [Tenuifilaceae bacterium]
MPRILELLAPAKDLQTGIAAIKHGADAVYIAADRFGAREKAGNSIDDIEKLVYFAHQYFARVYVTVNTIIYEEELNDVKKLINDLYRINVDAIIIQDFAILNMDIPPISIHASTQMHNNSSEKIQFLEKQGIERVVLPRELSITEIIDFRANTTAELECFIHGALCVCYSGQCYMSQAITGRSANRGACAQPCRSAYDLVDSDGNILVKNKHLLSLKDLNLSQHIHQLIDAGITSFKIEGRMKDVAYVKNTVAFYNSLINNIISTKPDYKRLSSGRCEYSFTPDLERTFNRGFTKHFVDGRISGQASYHSQKSIGKQLGRVMQVETGWFSIDSSEPINNGDGLCFFNSKGELNGFLVNSTSQNKIYPNQEPLDLKTGIIIYRNSDFSFDKAMKGESSTRKISVSISVKQDNGKLQFIATDEDLIRHELSIDDNFELAKNPQIATSNLINQLTKSGETIFQVIKINLDSGIEPKHLAISELNAIRRSLLDGLKLERLRNYSINKRLVPTSKLEYPLTSIDFKGNVANSASKEFLKKSGVKNIANAFELDVKQEKIELMVTKYCIKYELGLCPSKQNAKPTKALFLKDNHNIFPLVFNCNECQMIVLSPESK